jgi:hypothetical protein
MTRKLKFIALTLATALGAVAPAMVQQGMAQQIGTATAVNPSTEGTPPGGSTTTLTIGARVLHKERIHTSPTGSVQLLFLDKSTLSIARNTTLVIDEFVYDPASKSGQMLTKLTQGTLQYIGGARRRHRHSRRHRHPHSGSKGIAGPQSQWLANRPKRRRYVQHHHELYEDHSQLVHAARAAGSDPARPGPP